MLIILYNVDKELYYFTYDSCEISALRSQTAHCIPADHPDEANYHHERSDFMSKNFVSRILSVLTAGSMLLLGSANSVSVAFAEDNDPETGESTPVNTVSTVSAANGNYAISDVVITDGTASVSYHADDDCTLVLSFFNDDGTIMKSSCTTALAASEYETTVDVPLPAETPEYYLLNAFLLDTATFVPLSEKFESTLYTEEIQRIAHAKASDFDSALTVSFDGSEDNFIVLKDSVYQIPYNGKTNLLAEYDETANTYTFTNPDSELLDRTAGEVVFCEGGSMGDMVLFTVSTISVENDQAVVYASETDLEEAADMIRLNSPLEVTTNDQTQDAPAAKAKPGVPNMQPPVLAGDADQNRSTRNKSEGSVTLPPENWQEFSDTVSDMTDIGFDVNDFVSLTFSGQVKLSYILEPELIFYWSPQRQYLDFDMDITVTIGAKIAISASVEIPLPVPFITQNIPLKGILRLKTGIFFFADGSISAEAEAEYKTHLSITSDAPYLRMSAIKPTKARLEVKAKCFFGVEGKIEVGIGKYFKIGAYAKAGPAAEATLTSYTTGIADNKYGWKEETQEYHRCNTCLKGQTSVRFVWGVTASIGVNDEDDDKKGGSKDKEEKEWWNLPSFNFTKEWTSDCGEADFYYSYTFNEWGFGECPFYGTTSEIENKGSDKDDLGDVIVRHNGMVVFTDWGTAGHASLEIEPDGSEYEVSTYHDGIKLWSGTFNSNTADDFAVKGGTRSFEYSHGCPFGSDWLIYPPGFEDEFSPNYQHEYHIFSSGEYLLSKEGHALIHKLYPSTGGVIPEFVGKYPVTGFSLRCEDEDLSAFSDITITKTFLNPYSDGMTDNRMHNTGVTTLLEPATTVPYNSLSGSTMSGIVLPETLEAIGIGAFHHCPNLTSVIIPDNCSFISAVAFEDCTSLSEIRLPEKLEFIGASAFHNTALTSVHIPGKTEVIGRWAFYECKSLTDVTIDNGLTSINEMAFADCTSLRSITLPDSLLLIDVSAFENCTSLTEIKLPEGLKDIESNAFLKTGITSIEFPDSLETVRAHPLTDCMNLKSITLPKNNPFLNNDIANNCPELTDIYYKGTMEDWFDNNYELAYFGKEGVTIHFLEEPDGEQDYADQEVLFVYDYTDQDEFDAKSTRTASSVQQLDGFPQDDPASSNEGHGLGFSTAQEKTKCLLIATTDADNALDTANLRWIGQGTTDENGCVRFSLAPPPDDTVCIMLLEKEDGSFIRYVGSLAFLLGDLNGDTIVNASDAAQILIAAAVIGAGQDSGLTEAQKNAADVNHDSSINASDAAVILIYAAAIGAGQDVKLTDFVH